MRKDSIAFEIKREQMVIEQIESRGITDINVLAAMRKVSRHLFVSEPLMDQADGDYPLPIGEDQTRHDVPRPKRSTTLRLEVLSTQGSELSTWGSENPLPDWFR